MESLFLKKIIILFLLFIVFLLKTSSQAQDIQIIVHLDNPINKIKLIDLKNIFLVKKKTWKNGNPIIPTNLKANHPAREKLLGLIGKSSQYLIKLYLKLALSGRGQPPKSFNIQKEVLEFVSNNKNAIGYVFIPDGSVKTVKIKE